MSLSRLALGLMTMVALAASTVWAQPVMTRYPGGDYPGGPVHTPEHSPFIDHEYFDVDWQWFAPAEVGMYGGGPRPNTGWFFTFDRMNVHATRSDQAGMPFQADPSWGNRVDIGYMTEDECGWLFEAFAVRGPNEVERSALAGTPPTSNLLERINVAKSSGVELNRVWRLKPLHYGTNIEPFIGFRFNQVTDYTGVNGAGVSPPAVNVIENNILGLQGGYRMSHKTGHWVLSNEFRFAACQNWQFGRQGDSAAFVPVGDIRLEAAYELSREVALRVGWQMIYYGDGIRRGDPAITINDQIITENQDFLMHGVTFGIAVNR